MTDSRSTSDIQSKVAQTRAQLESTLDEIEDKLNVPKQAGIFAEKAQASYEENPVPWVAGVTAAVAIVGGLIAWAVLSRD
jgi:ElaB/YqjD/DUF883 family membrane-anchored ribosome-binding protein